MAHNHQKVPRRSTEEVIEVRRHIVDAVKAIQSQHTFITAEMLSAYLQERHKTKDYSLYTLGNNLRRLREFGALTAKKCKVEGYKKPQTCWFLNDENYTDPQKAKVLVVMPEELHMAAKAYAQEHGLSVNATFVKWLKDGVWAEKNPQ